MTWAKLLGAFEAMNKERNKELQNKCTKVLINF